MIIPHKKFKQLLITPDGFKNKDIHLEEYSINLSDDNRKIINKFEFEVGRLYSNPSGPIKIRLVPFEEPFSYKINVYKKNIIKELYETEDCNVKNKINLFQFISIPKKTYLVFLESSINFWQSGNDSVFMFYWCFLYGDKKIVYESTQFHSAYNTFFPV